MEKQSGKDGSAVQALLGVSKVIDAFTQRVGVVAYWLLPIMVLVGVYNVFGRFLPQVLRDGLGIPIDFNLTSNALIESQWYLFSLTFFLGAPYALLHNEHVRVDVVYGRLSPRRQTWINILGTMLFLLPFCILLIYFSWDFIGISWRGWEQSPDPSGLPRYPIKTLIAVGAVLLIIQGISEMIKNVARLTGHLPLHDEHAQEELQPQEKPQPQEEPQPPLVEGKSKDPEVALHAQDDRQSQS